MSALQGHCWCNFVASLTTAVMYAQGEVPVILFTFGTMALGALLYPAIQVRKACWSSASIVVLAALALSSCAASLVYA